MSWQDNRRQAHREGKHAVPQVDCQLCWDEGRIQTNREPEDTEGLWHRGQHPDCSTCTAFRETHRPPADPL